eukprot:CAMPEP_0194314752 /NCGR_PEP_ID=MMETSP0171-20130528/11593_1 /TAXON_ID=218684 /ORGANISM="Corethron pennatum, Strain L29A3" /LENGTH=655 /DNA_ID=CAMNT_0039070307 /DNA_START=228 /DNA_END=2191 /DNA_ORIENTATION=+
MTETTAISFDALGERTSIPITISEARFKILCQVPFLGRTLATLELTVKNSTVDKNIASKLRLVLPLGATVKKFEFLKASGDGDDPVWYPAAAVPKKKAKEVVYKEKERGRDVAAVSDLVSGSNVFEIEIAPLPYKREVKCRLEFLFVGGSEEIEKFATACFPTAHTSGGVPVSIMVEQPDEDVRDEDRAGCVVGECFGNTHFVCRIPKPVFLGNPAKANALERIAVVWDTSASMMTSGVDERFGRIEDLASKCGKVVGKPVIFELFVFSSGPIVCIGTFDNAENLIESIRALDYDGGTDVTSLTRLFEGFATRTGEKQIDTAIVFSDGMDSLSRTPNFSDHSYDMHFPVHCVATGDAVNMRCLNSIASASLHVQGSVIVPKDDNYDAILYPQPVIRSVVTDQSDEAFMGEVEDGFCCVPDHRLRHMNHTIRRDGVFVAGILDDPAFGTSTVTRLSVVVACGTEVRKYVFRLRKCSSGEPKSSTPDSTEFLDAIHLSGSSWKEGGKHGARILGHIYAEELYSEAVSVGLKSGIDTHAVQQELAINYGFCSPESSLLMLFTVQQFMENDILPPVGHPVYNDPEVVDARKLRRAESHHKQGNNTPKRGEIGSLKTDDQLKKVIHLATRLEVFLKEPIESDTTHTKDAIPSEDLYGGAG